jgi:hypothetical protein
MPITRFLAATALACAAAVSLSGCGTLGASQNLAPVIDALANAGCMGDLQLGIQAGSAAGLSPGAFAVSNTFHGSCDPARARPAVTPAALSAAMSQAIATTPPPPQLAAPR